jgi:DNA-binding response OmpR family regulator
MAAGLWPENGRLPATQGGMPLPDDKIGQSNAVRNYGNPAFQPLTADGTRICALAIDDDEEFLKPIKELLEPYGVDVHAFADPVKALDTFDREKNNIHLVLLDYCMPRLDGTKTFEWLKKLNPDVKVIIVSGFDELRLRQILAKYPIDDYIHKPLRIQEALQVIRHVMTKTGPKPVAH